MDAEEVIRKLEAGDYGRWLPGPTLPPYKPKIYGKYTPAILEALEAHPDLSCAKIAGIVGCSHTLVWNVKSLLKAGRGS